MVTDLCVHQNEKNAINFFFKPFLDHSIVLWFVFSVFFRCNQNITRSQHLCRLVIIKGLYATGAFYYLHFNIEHPEDELIMNCCTLKTHVKLKNYYCEKKLFIRPEIATWVKKRARCALRFNQTNELTKLKCESREKQKTLKK